MCSRSTRQLRVGVNHPTSDLLHAVLTGPSAEEDGPWVARYIGEMVWRGSGVGALGATALVLACGGTDSNAPHAAGGADNRGGSEAGSTTATAGDGNEAVGGASGGASTVAGSAGTAQGQAGDKATGGAPAADGSTGTIQVGQRFDSAVRFIEASARFSAKDAVATADCTLEKFGDCQVATCTPNGKTAPIAPYAGDITITDGGMVDVKLTTTPGQSYAQPSGRGGSLSGGERLTVSATGGDVPAFSTEIAVPRVITINAPVVDDMGSAPIPTSGDLALTFDNRAADGESDTKLYVTGSSGTISVSCLLPTETGTASIPAAVLDKVRGSNGSLILLTTRTRQIQAGAFSVSVAAYVSAMNPAKSKAVTFKL